MEDFKTFKQRLECFNGRQDCQPEKQPEEKKPLNSHKVFIFLVLKCEIKCRSFLIFKNLAECPNVLHHPT